MGIWGAGLFSDDVACDVRDTYRRLLGDQVPDDEAERRVLEEFLGEGESPTVVVLALASTQAQVGRLSPSVRERALEIIDNGTDLAGWADEKPSVVARRRTMLRTLRDRLTAPPRPRTTVRREWRYRTDLEKGDVLTHVLPDGEVRALLVVRVRRDDDGDWPVLELLDHRGPDLPVMSDIEELVARRADGVTTGRVWQVGSNHAFERDWPQHGYTRLGRVADVPALPPQAYQPRPRGDIWPLFAQTLAAALWSTTDPRPPLPPV